MVRKDAVILRKVISEARLAVDMIREYSLAEFVTDEKTKRAICMTVINIGELVKGLSLELRTAYPYIPWKDIAGFRDIAAHKYQTLRMEDVYHTVTIDLPDLEANISKILEDNATLTGGNSALTGQFQIFQCLNECDQELEL